jgi:inhibitor of cysteine peptidase
MKNKLMAVLAIILAAAALAGCATKAEANRDTNVIVTMEEFTAAKNIQKQLELEKGAVLNVILGSNPSTGYSWTESAVLSDTAVLKQTSHEYVEPGKTTQPVVGAAGHERWSFTAAAAGTDKITVKYARPWEKDTPAEWTFELTVVVK